jgi:hypothetical protein
MQGDGKQIERVNSLTNHFHSAMHENASRCINACTSALSTIGY